MQFGKIPLKTRRNPEHSQEGSGVTLMLIILSLIKQNKTHEFLNSENTLNINDGARPKYRK